MNIQQLQYVLAVAENKHFELAASKCFITQSTLSTMISKFEDEIGIRVFDRKKKPVEITSEGLAILEQIKVILRDIDHLNELTKEIKGEIKGNLTISVIPTIAPFLLPLFLQRFSAKFPNLKIKVREQTTSEIIRQLKSRELDIGIISTPVQEKEIAEIRLYDEPFVYYDAKKTMSKNISIDKIDPENLFLMEEGHCLRTQVIRLCDIRNKHFNSKINFEYKAGSIDSLLRFVNANEGSTLLPYLSTVDFSAREKKHVAEFSSPVPYRSIGLAVHQHFVKKKILTIMQQDIVEVVSTVLPTRNKLKGNQLLPLK